MRCYACVNARHRARPPGCLVATKTGPVTSRPAFFVSRPLDAGDRAQETYRDLLRRAEDLKAQADAAGERASAEAEQAWRAVSDALAQLEAEIRDAANG